MAKGYWVAHVDVKDPEGYKAYVAANAKAFSKYGARFLVRGGRFECKECSACAQCGAGIQGLRHGAGLLQLAGIRAGNETPAHRLGRRRDHHRSLRRPTASLGACSGATIIELAQAQAAMSRR
jgi:hypothetical protein